MKAKFEKQQIIDWGRSVLQSEADAIMAAKDSLGEDFYNAVNLILGCKGKLVVSGLGKSGHVGRKVSSTLASTGTASFFLHPSEALHGDLGMIGPDDVLLLIAYSGETAEVLQVAKFARRRDIPIISITGNLKSSLSEVSYISLNGCVNIEADSLGLAPTSSSTLALSLGDALAVAIMRYRGFNQTDFAAFHPGGKLGRKLSHVIDHVRILHNGHFLTVKSSFHDALKSVTLDNLGISAVLDDSSNIIGSVTDGDIRRLLLSQGPSSLSILVGDFMSTKPKVIESNILAVDAVDIMNSASITALFVKCPQAKSSLAILRMHDLLAAKVV